MNKKLCVIFYNKYNLREKDYFPKVYFLNLLTRKLEEHNYRIILLKSDYPNEIKKIKEKIHLLLNFEDYYIRFSREFHSNMNLKQVYKFFVDLEKSGTKIYPPPKFHIYTNSKKYALQIYKKKEFVLPHSKTFLLKKTKLWEPIIKYCKKLNKLCDFIVIKVSFSADMIDIFYIRNNKSKTIRNKFIEYEEFNKVIQLYNSYIDKDELDLVIIIQPYNIIVSNRLTEYRLWFLDGEFVNYFCHGPIKENDKIRLLDNVKYNPQNKIHFELVSLANKLYKFIVSKNKNVKILALRLDMSYAIDDIFIDKYSKIINNQKYRFYCNEMENIDGTFYINIPILNTITNKKEDTSFFQNKLVKILIDNLT